MQPENSPAFSSLDELLAGNGFNYGFPASERLCSSSFDPLEFAEKTEARSSAASENHKVAERRRRERINGHLDRLRALLLCNSKTDKASVLAKVVERVRELKEEASEMMQLDEALIPSELDEITVVVLQNKEICGNGKSVVKASLCCEDRVDLISDLIRVLKPLPLIPLRAEMVTLGGRVRNVMVLAGDQHHIHESIFLLRDAFKSLLFTSNYIQNNKDIL